MARNRESGIDGFLSFWLSLHIDDRRFSEVLLMAMQRTKPQTRGGADKVQTLNFRVTAEFKKAFKGYAVAQGVSMTDLLKEGFLLSKKAREK